MYHFASALFASVLATVLVSGIAFMPNPAEAAKIRRAYSYRPHAQRHCRPRRPGGATYVKRISRYRTAYGWHRSHIYGRGSRGRFAAPPWLIAFPPELFSAAKRNSI